MSVHYSSPAYPWQNKALKGDEGKSLLLKEDDLHKLWDTRQVVAETINKLYESLEYIDRLFDLFDVKVMLQPIEYVIGEYIDVRAANILDSNDIRLIGELVQLTEYEFLKLKGAGKVTMRNIKEGLSENNLGLGMPMSPLMKQLVIKERLKQLYKERDALNASGTATT